MVDGFDGVVAFGEFLVLSRGRAEDHAWLVSAKITQLLVRHIHPRMNGQPARSWAELAIGLESALDSPLTADRKARPDA